MNAPVNEQIKAEAASSLLERMAEKTKLVRFFRYNASAKHGVPIDADEKISITPSEQLEKQNVPEQPAPTQNVVQIVKTDEESSDRIAKLEQELERQKQSTQTTVRDNNKKETLPLSDKVKGILQTLAIIGGLGAAAFAGSQLGKTDEAPKDKQQEASPYYSPYQYLEDTGEHLP